MVFAFIGSTYFCWKNQGRETAKTFPPYTMGTERNFLFRFHCIQWERFYRFSSLEKTLKYP
jgi:hypothetical protein